MKTSEWLRHSFRKFEGGKKWVKGEDLDNGYCALSATAGHEDMSFYLQSALPAGWGYVSRYNDHPLTKFSNIRALYGKAILLAEIDECKSEGNRRLLRAALAVREGATFSMMSYVSHGIPQCVLGWYAHRTDLQSYFRLSESSVWLVSTRTGCHVGLGDLVIRRHFDITPEEAGMLFSPVGCDNAETKYEAFNYIRAFVRRREAAL